MEFTSVCKTYHGEVVPQIFCSGISELKTLEVVLQQKQAENGKRKLASEWSNGSKRQVLKVFDITSGDGDEIRDYEKDGGMVGIKHK